MSGAITSDCISKICYHSLITFNVIFVAEQPMPENRVVFLSTAKSCLITN